MFKWGCLKTSKNNINSKHMMLYTFIGVAFVSVMIIILSSIALIKQRYPFATLFIMSRGGTG